MTSSILTHARRGALAAAAAAALALGATACTPATTVLDVAVDDGRGGHTAYTVRCGPDGAATVSPARAGIDPARACAVADGQRTLLTQGPPPGRYCAYQYHGPQRATVSGHVDDAPVALSLARNDSCAEADWRRLEGLLPRP